MNGMVYHLQQGGKAFGRKGSVNKLYVDHHARLHWATRKTICGYTTLPYHSKSSHCQYVHRLMPCQRAPSLVSFTTRFPSHGGQ